MLYEGNAHRFGDNVTTDDVIAGKYKHKTMDLDELAMHLMENIHPDFVAGVKPGDFIVAGANFGCGSSREQAAQIIKHVGITAVVAPSFARIFFRNAINIGLLLVTCDTRDIQQGDLVQYFPDDLRLEVPARGLIFATPRLAPQIMEIVAAGGLLAYIKEKGGW
ncbi:MAG TPA: 3-isopropylmalate dehydratase [Ktedonobacteraceae bacterium]|jgi:3-isopropylmalate/(R)-2-methylmalate dehydratase small subunit